MTMAYNQGNKKTLTGITESGQRAALKMFYHELEPLNPLAVELELANQPSFLFFGKTRHHGKSVYQLILFPRAVSACK